MLFLFPTISPTLAVGIHGTILLPAGRLSPALVQECGFIAPERISVVKIQLDVGTEDWEGQHEKPELLRKGAAHTGDIVDALVFHWASN